MTYITSPVISQLQEHCDFWSMNGRTCYLPDAAYEQSQGRKCGFYNGVRPYCGEDAINTDAIDWRVQPWICWRYNLDQYFYWETTNWGYRKGAQVDVLNKNRSNGNGYLFYPGEDVIFPDSSRRLPGPLSSIRIKNWRRGMQDYEYLWLARQSGLKSEVDAIVKRCVPAALSEADTKKSISWPSRGYGFELYRRQLANLIAGKTGTARGKVTDKGTGKPIQGAKVTDGIRSDTTDATGTYIIDAIVGTRTVTASAAGYMDSAQEGVTVIENGKITANLQLTRDTTPPVISNVQAARVTSTKATITWNTDEASSSLLKYGTSPGVYAESVTDSSCVTSHKIDINGLSPETTYYCTVCSKDRSDNSADSTEYSFKTLMVLELVGLWHFDEGKGKVAHDSAKYGNDGTLVKGPTWVEGKIGKALQFDGVDDYVKCGNPVSLNNITNEITFIAWVKPFKADGCIVRKWDWSDYGGYHLDIYTGVYDSTFNLKMGYGGKTLLILGMALRLNEFSHIAFTASDSEVVFYLNGHVVSKTIPRKPIDLRNPKDVIVGGGSGWSGKYFNGVIDEVKIYGRALSSEEIKADHLRESQENVGVLKNQTITVGLQSKEAHSLARVGVVSAAPVDYAGYEQRKQTIVSPLASEPIYKGPARRESLKPIKPEDKRPEFNIAYHFCSDPHAGLELNVTEQELDEDFERIKAIGFTHVTLWAGSVLKEDVGNVELMKLAVRKAAQHGLGCYIWFWTAGKPLMYGQLGWDAPPIVDKNGARVKYMNIWDETWRSGFLREYLNWLGRTFRVFPNVAGYVVDEPFGSWWKWAE